MGLFAIAAALWALASKPQVSPRYQLQVDSDGFIRALDVTSGQLWVKPQGGEWKKLKGPIGETQGE